MLQNGGYGNIIYNVVYLLQKRITTFFNGEDFDDVKFGHLFLKFLDMMQIQEDLINPPILFSMCLEELKESVANLKFTKHGVRINKVPDITQKRAKSNDMSFRIRNVPNAAQPQCNKCFKLQQQF